MAIARPMQSNRRRVLPALASERSQQVQRIGLGRLHLENRR